MPGACWRAGRALAPRGSEMQGWVTCKSTEAPFVLARPPRGSEVSCPQEAQPRASAHSSHLVSVTSQPGPAGTSHGRGTSPNPRAATTRGPGTSDKKYSVEGPKVVTSPPHKCHQGRGCGRRHPVLQGARAYKVVVPSANPGEAPVPA